MVKKKEISIGVIGAGYWGKNLIRNFSQTDSVKLSYICDSDQNKLTEYKKIYRHVNFTPSYLDIIQDKTVDAVAIALPVSKHFKYAREALNSGKHVLLEKPMTDNYKEAQELVKLAEKKGLILIIDHIWEYTEAIKKIKEIYNSKQLGKIHYIRADWHNLGLLQPDINVIWDLAPHLISTINSITKCKLKSVNATAQGCIRKEIPEFGRVQLNYSNGFKAYLSFGWLEPRKTRELTIVGSKKMLVYDMTNDVEPIKIYDKSVNLIKQKDIQSRIDYKSGDIVSPAIKNIEALSTLCSHFRDCIINKIKPITSGADGAKIIEALEAIDKSVDKNGVEVKL